MKKTMAALAVVGCLSVAACGGPQKRPQSSEQGEQGGQQSGKAGGLGQTRSEEGSTEIQREEKIVRSEVKRYNIPTVRVCSERADINRMDAEDFVALGFRKDDAERIIRHREEVGMFGSVSDLRAVPGLDPKFLARINDRLAAGHTKG